MAIPDSGIGEVKGPPPPWGVNFWRFYFVFYQVRKQVKGLALEVIAFGADRRGR